MPHDDWEFWKNVHRRAVWRGFGGPWVDHTNQKRKTATYDRAACHLFEILGDTCPYISRHFYNLKEQGTWEVNSLKLWFLVRGC